MHYQKHWLTKKIFFNSNKVYVKFLYITIEKR